MPTVHDPVSPFQLLVTPERAALAEGQATLLRVLVRVQAPGAPPEALPGARLRDPLHLALVLDRSGSMAGAPLDEAKRCAAHIVGQMRPDDRVALVVFDDQVECLAALSDVGSKLAISAAIRSVESGGSTDLHGGWRAGADELAAKLVADGVHRVILLSDGCANQGETDLETITGQCRDLYRRGVSTSTYGLGRGFNEDLMLAMAKAGRGNLISAGQRHGRAQGPA